MHDNREAVKNEIRSRWRDIIPTMTSEAKRRVNGEKSYICPLCGHGKGGDGLTINKGSKTGYGLKCFGCDFSGDIIDLYQQTSGEEFAEAVATLADRIGIDIAAGAEKPARAHTEPKTASTIKQETTEEKTQEEPAADYIEYYKLCAERLKTSAAALSYLEARGITEKVTKLHLIGFDPAADPASAPGAMGNEYKPHPTPRIIIPTTKSHYVARSIDPNTEKQYMKLNPSREKGAGGAGLFNRRILEYGGCIFITEGVFDAMSVEMLGVKAIALNSTSNAELFIEQVKKIKPAASFVICLDNDDAGQKATAQIEKELKQLNYACVRADICGNYKDPNEALQADIIGFYERIEKAYKMAERAAGNGIDEFLDKIQSEAYKPYQTGLKFFDNLLGGGVVQQSLLLLMAAPGTGKTTLCQQIAEEMAARKNPVVYLNLEMSREQMFAKAISGRMARKGNPKTALEILQGYNWSPEDKEAIIEEIEAYKKDIYPYMKYNPAEIGSDIDDIMKYLDDIGKQAQAAGEQAPAVIVDYLHLMSSGRGLEIQELIKQSVIGLKKYAKDYNTFVIGIVATNRASNSGPITMDSGRDSSNIEYTGDYILSLNYFDIDNGTVKAGEVEKIAALQQEKYRRMILRILKGRFTAPGKAANVYFNAENNLFYGANEYNCCISLPVGSEIAPFAKKKSDKPAKRY